MITIISVVVCAVAVWLSVFFRAYKRDQAEIQQLKVKGIEDEAKKIVASKSLDTSVHDFNKRYSGSGEGTGSSDKNG